MMSESEFRNKWNGLWRDYEKGLIPEGDLEHYASDLVNDEEEDHE